jgi:hypothetical protein
MSSIQDMAFAVSQSQDVKMQQSILKQFILTGQVQ